MRMQWTDTQIKHLDVAIRGAASIAEARDSFFTQTGHRLELHAFRLAATRLLGVPPSTLMRDSIGTRRGLGKMAATRLATPDVDAEATRALAEIDARIAAERTAVLAAAAERRAVDAGHQHAQQSQCGTLLPG